MKSPTHGPANVLPLSRVRPSRADDATRGRRTERAAEAAGQRTAARRLLRRVRQRLLFAMFALPVLNNAYRLNHRARG